MRTYTFTFITLACLAVSSVACSGIDEVEEADSALGARAATPLDTVTLSMELSWDSPAKVADAIGSQNCKVRTQGVIGELYGPQTNNERPVFSFESEYRGASTAKLGGIFTVPRYDLNGISASVTIQCKNSGEMHHQYTVDFGDASSEVRSQSFTRAVRASYAPSFTSQDRADGFAQIPFKILYRMASEEAPKNLISNCGKLANLPKERVQTSYLRLGTHFGTYEKAKKWSLGLNVGEGALALNTDAENEQRVVQHVAYCSEKKGTAAAPLLLSMSLAPRGSNSAIPVKVEPAFGAALAGNSVKIADPASTKGKIAAFRFRIPNENEIVTEATLLK